MGVKVGDIHPNNIVVTAEGFLRMVTRHSLPGQLSNFDKIIESITSDVYLGSLSLIKRRKRWTRR